MKTDNSYLYESCPVPKAIRTLAVPTIISQLITVIYNVADAFFIGQMGDPNQVAAATFGLPLFMFMTGIANLFGIGGASFISRSLGKGDRARAAQGAAFSIWCATAVALLYGVLLFVFRAKLLPMLGTDEYTYDYCRQYLFWTITIGSVPTILSMCLAHLVRAEGYSSQASLGIAMGGVLNILLDPVFIFLFGLGLRGAAIATMLSNMVSLLYYARFLYKIRDTSAINASPGNFTLSDGIPKEIFAVGFPNFLMLVMSVLSNTTLNKLISLHSNEAVAGMGIAKKVDMIIFASSNGLAQGVLSLIGYNYASGNRERMMKVIRTTFSYMLILSFGCLILLFACAAPISRVFIDNAATVAFAKTFLRILCLNCPAVGVTMLIIAVFQAVGRKTPPTILSALRKGCLDIPLMLILSSFIGVYGNAWATPISDTLTMVVALILFVPFYNRIKAKPETNS